MAALDTLPPWLLLVVVAVSASVAILWLLLPFAVFGIKGRLDRALREAEEIKNEIRALNRAVGAGQREPPRTAARGRDADLESVPSMRATRSTAELDKDDVLAFWNIRRDPSDGTYSVGGHTYPTLEQALRHAMRERRGG
jgi:hypothetical protein